MKSYSRWSFRQSVIARWMRAVSPAVALAILTGTAERAEAYAVTFEFAGEIDAIRDDDGLFEGIVEIGTPFSGSFTFESTTPDFEPDEPFGRYENSIISLDGEIGGTPFSLGDPLSQKIEVVDDSTSLIFPGWDTYTVSVVHGVQILDQTLSFNLRMADPTGVILSAETLPLVPPQLGIGTRETVGFGAEHLGVSFGGDMSVFVPEPGTLALLTVGALLLGRRSGTPRRESGRKRDYGCTPGSSNI